MRNIVLVAGLVAILLIGCAKTTTEGQQSKQTKGVGNEVFKL